MKNDPNISTALMHSQLSVLSLAFNSLTTRLYFRRDSPQRAKKAVFQKCIQQPTFVKTTSHYTSS
jgi:hypothetical protein